MPATDKLIETVLSQGKITYFGGNHEMRTLDGERILVSFLGLKDNDGKSTALKVVDNGCDTVNLELAEMSKDDLPNELKSFAFFEGSDQFDGPVSEIFTYTKLEA